MKPGLRDENNAAVPDDTVRSKYKLQIFHFVCDGSGVGKEEARWSVWLFS